MEHDPDISALRNLLALRNLDVPMDTEVNRFLIEFHRRQRAQLLVPASRWSRVTDWAKCRLEAIHLVPSLSYASGVAALAVMAFLGFSQQVQVTQADNSFKLSLHMPSSEASLAMIPTSFVHESTAAPSAQTDALTFTPNAAKPAATRFVLANTQVAYDATAAF